MVLTNFAYLVIGQTIIGLGVLAVFVVLLTNYLQNKKLAQAFNDREDTILEKVTKIEKYLRVKPPEKKEDKKDPTQ